MVGRNSAKLERSEWIDALRELSICCADDTASDARDRIRELNALLRMCPEHALIHGLTPIRPARLEELLSVDAFENAVMEMLEHGPGFLVSRSGDGQSLATIALPGNLQEKSGSGATPALALIGALALSLSNSDVYPSSSIHYADQDHRPALH